MASDEALALRHFVSLEISFLPDVLQARFQPALLAAAPLLIVLALWLVEREERWSRGVN